MAGFLGDLTVLAATTLAVWGLLLIRRGRTESSALLRAAGSLALVVGVGTGLYAGLYAVKYHRHGDLGRPYAIRAIDDQHPAEPGTGAHGKGNAPAGGMCGMCGVRDEAKHSHTETPEGTQAPAATEDDGSR